MRAVEFAFVEQKINKMCRTFRNMSLKKEKAEFNKSLISEWMQEEALWNVKATKLAANFM